MKIEIVNQFQFSKQAILKKLDRFCYHANNISVVF